MTDQLRATDAVRQIFALVAKGIETGYVDLAGRQARKVGRKQRRQARIIPQAFVRRIGAKIGQEARGLDEMAGCKGFARGMARTGRDDRRHQKKFFHRPRPGEGDREGKPAAGGIAAQGHLAKLGRQGV